MSHRSSRGFTLAELAVTMGVAGFAMSLVLLTFQSQQRSFEAVDLGRQTQEAARDATLELERNLRLAGYGLNPAVAFDFRHYMCPITNCRDGVGRPDEIVFHTRDPSYRIVPPGGSCADAQGCPEGRAWRLTGTSPNSVNLTARPGDVFRRGQVLQFICAGARTTTMGTVANTMQPVAAGGTLTVILQSAETGNPYKENAFMDACFFTSTATVFAVERYRYFIDTSNYEMPYLMLDTGVDLDRDGEAPEDGDLDDVLPVARGVEDLQVGYIFGRSPNFTPSDDNENWVVGDSFGVVEEPDPTLTPPTYQMLVEAPQRYTLHPANIRALRVNVAVRSPRPDPGPPPGWPGEPLPPRENRSTFTEYAQDHDPSRNGIQHRLRRFSARTTISTRNMASRAMFLF